jgi:Conserved TM helix
MNQMENFGAAMLTSLAAAMATLFAALPKILGFAIILMLGWFVATLIAKAVAAVLRTVKFNQAAQRAGFSDFTRKMGVDSDASGFLANIAKWFIRLIAMVVAFDALGLPAVSNVLRELLLWLPNLVVAMVVLVVAGLAADALAKLVRGATAQGGFSNPDALATVAKVAVWAFAIVIAVNQIGIAAALVNTLLMATVGALALAFGLAFGLGGRDTAARLLGEWKQSAENAAPKLKLAAEAAKADVQRESSQPVDRPPQPAMQGS